MSYRQQETQKFSEDDIKQFAFHLNVRGAYVQKPHRARLVGLENNIIIFSIDATALYPSIMILSNISEETLKHRIYDAVIVEKALVLIEKALKGEVKNAAAMFTNAIEMQFSTFVKKEKPQKMKETLEFNTKYYSFIFDTIVNSGYSFDDICKPVDEASYHLLKSYLHPLLEALTWTSPYNLGYNRTVVDYVYFNKHFDEKYSNKKFYIIDEIYSTKSSLRVIDIDILKKEYFGHYLLNPYGVMFMKHKDKLADDVAFLTEALDGRSVVKNEMLVLQQLLNNVYEKNSSAYKIMTYLIEDQFDKITEDLMKDAGVYEIYKGKKISDPSKLKVEKVGDEVASLEIAVFMKNLKQSAAKVFANSAFGIKGLLSFLFSAPILGNSITTGGKIYGIRLAQKAAAHVIDKHKKALPT